MFLGTNSWSLVCGQFEILIPLGGASKSLHWLTKYLQCHLISRMFSALQRRIIEYLTCKQAWEYTHDKADIWKTSEETVGADLDAEWADRVQNTEQFCVAVSLLTCIPEMLGSNLGQNTGYPDWDNSWSSSAPPEKFRDNSSVRLWPLLSNSSFINHRTNRHSV